MIFKMNKELEKTLTDSYIPKLINVAGMDIKVKQSLNYIERVRIASTVASAAFPDGEYNAMVEEVFRVNTLMEVYTDIVVEVGTYESIELYDIYIKSGIYDAVVRNIPELDLKLTLDLIDRKISEERDRLLNENSLSGVLNELIYVGKNLLVTMQTLQENGKIEEIVGGLAKELDKLDPDKLDYVNAFMEKVSQGENK